MVTELILRKSILVTPFCNKMEVVFIFGFEVKSDGREKESWKIKVTT